MAPSPTATQIQKLLKLDTTVSSLRTQVELLLAWAVTRFGDEDSFPIALKSIHSEIEESQSEEDVATATTEILIKQEYIESPDVDNDIDNDCQFSDADDIYFETTTTTTIIDDENDNENDAGSVGTRTRPKTRSTSTSPSSKPKATARFTIAKTPKTQPTPKGNPSSSTSTVRNNANAHINEAKQRYLNSLPLKYKPGPKSAKARLLRMQKRKVQQQAKTNAKVPVQVAEMEEDFANNIDNAVADNFFADHVLTQAEVEKLRPYPCETCGKRFTDSSTLKKHRQTHDKSRPTYACDICGSKYTTSYTLARHRASHTGLSFECNICGKIFKRKDYLTYHSNNIHRS